MRVPALLGFLLCLSASAPASAQDADARGRVHFEAGRQYFEEGAYEDAVEEFRRAYELSGYAELLMNIASGLERLGRWAEAADLMERYLEEADPDTVTNPDALRRRAENLRRRAAQGDPPDDVSPTPRDPPASTDPSGSGSGRVVGAAISFGVAGAGLVTFSILGGLALADRSSLENGCGATTSCSEDDVSGVRALSLGADIGLGFFAAGVVAGVLVLLLVDGEDDDEQAARTRVVPYAGADGGGLVVTGAL